MKKLKSRKSDGSGGLESDHIIHGTDTLNSIITVLICLNMVHGYVPVLINRSVKISIPKDKRASLRDCTNYKGITLCNAIAKVLDIYLLHRYNEYFYTSDMQYAFKESHSTVMCTAVLKEVVAIYNARGSNVYACLLDLSKAFDKSQS